MPVPSGRQSFQTHRRRRSSIVVDQGQADISAITSRRGSRQAGGSGLSHPVNAHEMNMALEKSHNLQVPVIDSTGRRISSSTASIKSGTVGQGPDIPARESPKVTPAVAGISPAADATPAAAQIAQPISPQSQQTHIADSSKSTNDSKQSAEQFHDAAESMMTSGPFVR